MNRIYLDNNATAPMHLESIEAMNAAVAISGNPSAQHADGRKANALISSAREKLGLAMGVCAQDVIFTGSGTEADNTAIHSAVKAGCKRLLVSAMDHPATIIAAQSYEDVTTEIIPANANGQTDMVWLKGELQSWDAELYGRPFVSITAANSETGAVQDCEQATELVRGANGLILIDAVQALGKLPMLYQPDYMSVSAHKIGGPKGVGALYVAANAPFTSLLTGGGQERRRRAGTMNAAGISGFGAAIDVMCNLKHTTTLRDNLEAGLKAMESEIAIFSEGVTRLPNTSFFAVPDVSSMTLMMALDLEGISVSTGMACSSGKALASRAITAMGLSEKAPKGAIRVSFGHQNTESCVDSFLKAWAKIRRKSVFEAAE